MRATLKRISYAYFGTCWVPAAVAVAMELAFIGAQFLRSSAAQRAVDCILTWLFVLSLLGMLTAAAFHFAKKQWTKGAANLILLPVVAVVGGLATAVAGFIVAFSGTSGDGFADHLTIPRSISIAIPQENHGDMDSQSEWNPSAKDPFQRAMKQALQRHGAADSTVTADIDSLLWMAKHHPNVLRRYLACSPAWRLFEEDGKVFATRRWLVGPHWHYELHGYYSNLDKGFQSRVTIGLSGEPWAGEAETELAPGKTAPLDLSQSGTPESTLLINGGKTVVEVFEESPARERRLTKAALAYMQREFGELAGSPHWARIEKMIATSQTPPSQPSIRLWNSFQPGIYESEIWANPGEPGRVYLRAYEVTHGTRLSDDRLKEYSNEWIGWSDDHRQLFLSNTNFTIYEGDWDKPYAARFEVWFVPDSGKPERKLMERVFRIEGWQR